MFAIAGKYRYDPAMPTGTVAANGLDYYYEIDGRGEPLLLLHGGLGSIEMVGAAMAELAKTRQVIGVDLHGHGRTALGDRAISYAAMGDDMAAILDTLGFRQVDAVGYSLGGGVAFRLAAQHPHVVKNLVLVGTAATADSFYPDIRPQQMALGAGLAEMMKPSPLYKTYARIAPHPEQFPKLLDQMGALMRSSWDWRADVAKITARTLLVFGDNDTYRLESIVELYKLFGGGQRDAGWNREHVARNKLAILPDVTHYDIFTSPLLVPMIERFLAA
jgi:pimeloyl-ACP methyl ester carboxylesterase